MRRRGAAYTSGSPMGDWLSWLERTVHIREVTGSNPVSPTTSLLCAPCLMAERALRVVLTTESYLPYVSGVTVSVDALARGLGAAWPRGARGGAAARRGRVNRRASGRRGPSRPTPGFPSYQLPRVAPPGYRMAWPNPAAAAWRHGARLPARRRPRPLAVRDGARGAAPGEGSRRAAGLHPSHPLRRLSPLPRPAGGPGIGPDRCVPAKLLGRMRGDRCAGLGPGGRHPLPAAGGAPRPGPRHPDRDRRRRRSRELVPVDPRPAGGMAAGRRRVVGTLGRLAPEKSPEADPRGDRRAFPMRACWSWVAGHRRQSCGHEPRLPDLAGRVHFTGALPRMEALARLGGADVFAFASRPRPRASSWPRR